ncbi:MAG: hypothetical protein JST11_17075 [Acidobacteria bacterium]|nr:hypothetical protein [Acidobacteriota bacterium]
MSIDEIRQQKGLVLLEYQEAENRVNAARSQLRHLSGTLDRLARILDPGEEPTLHAPNLNELQGGAFKKAMDYDAAMAAADELARAMDTLAQAQTKKRELGLRWTTPQPFSTTQI